VTASDDAIVSVTCKILKIPIDLLVSRFLFQARVLAWFTDWKGIRYMVVCLAVCLPSFVGCLGLSPLSFRSVSFILSSHVLRNFDYFLVCVSPHISALCCPAV